MNKLAVFILVFFLSACTTTNIERQARNHSTPVSEIFSLSPLGKPKADFEKIIQKNGYVRTSPDLDYTGNGVISVNYKIEGNGNGSLQVSYWNNKVMKIGQLFGDEVSYDSLVESTEEEYGAPSSCSKSKKCIWTFESEDKSIRVEGNNFGMGDVFSVYYSDDAVEKKVPKINPTKEEISKHVHEVVKKLNAFKSSI